MLVNFSRFYCASLSSRCAAQSLYAFANIGSAAKALCSELDFLESLLFVVQTTYNRRIIVRFPFMSRDGRRNHRSNGGNFNVAAQAEGRNLRRRHALSRRHWSIGSFVASWLSAVCARTIILGSRTPTTSTPILSSSLLFSFLCPLSTWVVRCSLAALVVTYGEK